MVTQNTLRMREEKQVMFEHNIRFAIAVDLSNCITKSNHRFYLTRTYQFLRYPII